MDRRLARTGDRDAGTNLGPERFGFWLLPENKESVLGLGVPPRGFESGKGMDAYRAGVPLAG